MSLVILFLTLVIAGCRNGTTYSTKLEKELTGLKKLITSERIQDSIQTQIQGRASLSFPVYSLNGDKLTQADITEKK